MKNAYAIIMAGGKGERFWPLSTARRPKQLLSLVGERTLLGQAVDRLQGLFPPERILVLTSADLYEATLAAVPELPPGNVVAEPMPKDTAAAVVLGAALVKARDPEGVFCILTSDHVIGKLKNFRQTLEESLKLAAKSQVFVTIGIEPTFPSSGYGYLETGEIHSQPGAVTFFQTKRFVEKPSVARATEYLQTGRFYWNSGMFVMSVETLASALIQFRTQLIPILDLIPPVVGTPEFAPTLARIFQQLEKISIDYAIMEKAGNIIMARGAFTWDDVGSWTALENHFDADAEGNVIVGEAEHFDARSNIVYSKDHLTALVGVENLIVVQSDGVTLVCHRDRAQDVKQLLARIKANKTHAGLL
jgi:mannose-1-phosphate guanylyltransferase